ncbi:MAG: class I SAM-dependent methyltransferase [Longimicrobiales bacterium]|nr:class I SAM-dependent methyltransferase [Longimicrobiales bacterium]
MAKSQRFRKFRKSSKTWDAPVLPLILGIIGGLLAAFTVSELEDTARGMAAFAHEDSLATLWAFLFGFFAVGVTILAIQKVTLRTVQELRAYINVRPLIGDRLLGADLWAMDAVFAENLATLLNQEPEHVVELGSGHSSVLIAARLDFLNHGHLVSVDHLERFADRTRRWIEARGVADRATVVHAPLEDHQIEGQSYSWYSMDVLERHLPDRIDMLVVDGPPAKLGTDMRWPAVPLLLDRLADDAVIILDDGDRGEETRIAYSWQEMLGGSIRYLPGGKGGWLLRRDG